LEEIVLEFSLEPQVGLKLVDKVGVLVRELDTEISRGKTSR
jgi:hypothetical protein